MALIILAAFCGWLFLYYGSDAVFHRIAPFHVGALVFGSHWFAYAVLCTLLLASVVLALIDWIRRRQQATIDRIRHSELLAMQKRFPHCHVARLRSGEFFLTDKSTGREYVGAR
ncbi:hypothetical protein [Paraburkholderia sp.]|uniref:hypothetical protein n=1 Tax=Paraburkholderia sp. TaxID=1926495 RepID=UPI002B4A1114|nr:hypothetical protein [Paraburkholderia sp.]